jgi:hypothetical protein
VAQNTPGEKLEMTDEQLENAQQRHLKFMDDRNVDVQLLVRAHCHVALDAPVPAGFWAHREQRHRRIVKLHRTAFAAWRNYPKQGKGSQNCVVRARTLRQGTGVRRRYSES